MYSFIYTLFLYDLQICTMQYKQSRCQIIPNSIIVMYFLRELRYIPDEIHKHYLTHFVKHSTQKDALGAKCLKTMAGQ